MQQATQDPISYRVALTILDFINSKAFWYASGYASLMVAAYLTGKFSAVSLSKYALNLLKQKKKLARVQRKMHLIRQFKSWALWTMVALVVIALGLVGTMLYMKFGTVSLIWKDPWIVQRKIYTELWGPLTVILGLLVLMLGVRRVLTLWQKSLLNDQEETKHVKDNFIKSLFHELGDDITDSVFMSIGQDLMTENKELVAELQSLKESANSARKEIIVKRTYAESYADFMQALGSFNWCSNCMKPLIGKSLQSSPSGTNIFLVNENGSPNPNSSRKPLSPRDIEKKDEPSKVVDARLVDPGSKDVAPAQSTQPSISSPTSFTLQRSASLLVCHNGCLTRYLNHVEQLKKKMKEQHAEIRVLEKQLESTLRNQIFDDIDFNDPPSKN